MKNKEKKSQELKIIFAGTSPLAKTILESLFQNKFNVITAITQSNKKAGRKKEIAHNPVKEFCENNKIPLLQPEKLDKDFIKEIKKMEPDLIVVAAYGKILPQSFLDIPKFGSLNIHPSLLPELRGPSPIQNALLLGHKKTGITIMLMDAGIDTGDIITQYEVEIDPNDTNESLSEKMAKYGSELLTETIPLWVDNKIEPKKQSNSHATLCQLIEKNDGKILWNESAQEIYNKFRAFYSWPGIFCFWQEDQSKPSKRIRLSKISISEQGSLQEKHRLGEVFTKEDVVYVQAAKNLIVLEKIQLEGKKETSIQEFINGYPSF